MKSPLSIIILFLLSTRSLFAEVEPNGDCLTANPVNLGTSITGNFSLPNDKDYFSFTIAQVGLYVVEVQHPDSTLQIKLTVQNFPNCNYGYSLQSIYQQGYLRKFVFFLTDTGKQYINLQLTQGTISVDNYTLSISRNTDDPFEYNNTFETATDIPLDNLVTAYLQGTEFKSNFFYDVDYYKVIVPAKGILDTKLPLVPFGTSIRVFIYDSIRQLFAGNCCDDPGVPMECLQTLICDPGIYYILITRNSTISPYTEDPYQLIVKFTADSTECNQDSDHAYPIENRQNISAFSSGKDLDWYTFRIAQTGIFDIDFQRPDTFFQYGITILNQGKNEIFQSYYYGPGGLANGTDYSLCDTGIYYMKLEDRTNNDCNRNGKFTNYQMQLHNVFPDEYECNNTYQTATPVSGKDTVYAALASFQDTDLYKIFLQKSDTLYISLDSIPSDIHFEEAIIKSPNLKLQSMHVRDSARISFINNSTSGDFFIRLFAGGFEHSYQQYRMILDKRSLATSTVDGELEKVEITPTISSDELHVIGRPNEAGLHLKYAIVNSLGMMTQEFTNLSNSKVVKIENLINGVYTLILYNGNHKPSFYKFIKI